MIEVRRVVEGSDRVTLAVAGEVDLSTAPQLADALAAALRNGVTEVVVDLAGVDFLDSSGVRVLVEAAGYAEQANAKLTVQGARDWVERVLEITGVGKFLQAPAVGYEGTSADDKA